MSGKKSAKHEVWLGEVRGPPQLPHQPVQCHPWTHSRHETEDPHSTPRSMRPASSATCHQHLWVAGGPGGCCAEEELERSIDSTGPPRWSVQPGPEPRTTDQHTQLRQQKTPWLWGGFPWICDPRTKLLSTLLSLPKASTPEVRLSSALTT